MKKSFFLVFPLFFLFWGGVMPVHGAGTSREYLLLDNFQSETAQTGTAWEGFTDQVMGGVSELSVNRVSGADGAYLRMRGRVSTENRGGFIQVRLKFNPGRRLFDHGFLRPLNVTKLKSLALAAYGRDFQANLEVREVGLY